MAKRKKQNKGVPTQNNNEASVLAPRRRKRILVQRDRFLAVAGLLLVSFIAYKWWSFASFEQRFLALAAEGEVAMVNIQDFPSRGGGHLAPGQSYTYSDRFPTSGPHDIRPIDPGFYRDIQRPTQLVHSLEHGHIVIYYDQPASAALNQIRGWASHYNGHWDGIVIVPAPNLGEEIVLSAWTRILRLKPFDPAAAAAFIDRYRGRGPENPVR
jgi:hypothetical protein